MITKRPNPNQPAQIFLTDSLEGSFLITTKRTKSWINHNAREAGMQLGPFVTSLILAGCNSVHPNERNRESED